MDHAQEVYNAAYQAFRGNYTEQFASALSGAFDISFQVHGLKTELEQAAWQVAESMQRPSVLYKPTLTSYAGDEPEGEREAERHWRASYCSVKAYGPTPELAMAAFDKAWKEPGDRLED